jgi:hypothetical protein
MAANQEGQGMRLVETSAVKFLRSVLGVTLRNKMRIENTYTGTFENKKYCDMTPERRKRAVREAPQETSIAR